MNIKQLKPQMPSESSMDDSDEVYFSTFEPGVTVNLEYFQRDLICKKCGCWKTEHDFLSCSSPDFTA